MEKLLGTPARIYYKYEGVSPAGSHKPNSSVPQAWYNAQEGVKKIVTETGAGQWGSALAFACSIFDLDCEVRVALFCKISVQWVYGIQHSQIWLSSDLK